MKTFTVRFDDDVSKELDTLTQMFNVSKNAFISTLIRQEYSKYGEDPKVKKIMRQLNEMQSLLDKFKAEENENI